MSEEVTGSRANIAVTELAQFLEDKLGFQIARHWAHPDIVGKSTRPLGAVTFLRSTYELQGTEEFEEPATGESAIITKLGIETLELQVDLWAPTIDDRFVIHGQLERLFETGEESNDGMLFLSMPQGAGTDIRYTREGVEFNDTPQRAGTRDWRLTMDLTAVVDITVTEYVPLMDITIRLRREGFVTPPPPPNTLGETLTEQDFKPEG